MFLRGFLRKDPGRGRRSHIWAIAVGGHVYAEYVASLITVLSDCKRLSHKLLGSFLLFGAAFRQLPLFGATTFDFGGNLIKF